MSYKRLGDLVKFISKKNVEGTAVILYGINIDKFFMPSVANTIGVDLKKYKVVTKHQFACNRMHVGRDERLPISMSTHDYDFIVSPAYDVFELTSKDVLPEYLMMWFSRKEFDRQCWFYTDADVRGGLSLDALKSIEILIPSIEEQRELVKQYHTISDKIKVNEQICEKLEATAQTLYKHWFVDFEFPNEDGKSYKSFGGKMVFNEELAKEIPEGWLYNSFTSNCKIAGGGTPKTDILEYWQNGEIPFYTPGDKTFNIYTLSTVKKITKEGLKKCSSKLYPKNTTFLTARGATTGGIALSGIPMAMNQTCYAILSLINTPIFSYFLTRSLIDKLKTEAIGATFEAIVTKNFDETFVVIANERTITEFEKRVNSIFKILLSKTKFNQKLIELQSLLLSRLATLEVS